jgi:hypothetical protein
VRVWRRMRKLAGSWGLFRHLTVVMAYLLLTLVMTYPLGLRLNTHLFASTNDFWIYPWNNWWVKKALMEGYDVYHTPYLFYPKGVDLFWHGFSWFSTFLWLPLQAVLGSLAAHNVTILLTYVVGAYTAYLLSYEVTGSHPAAFVAGLVYAFYPHRFSHRGQLKLLSNQWNPLFALFLVRLTRRGGLRDGVGGGVTLALAGLCGWHQLALTGIWGAIWLVYSLLVERRWWSRRTVLALLLCGLIGLVLIAPFLVPMLLELARSQGLGLEPSATQATGVELQEKSSDLLAFVLPTPDHFLLQIDGLGERYRSIVHFEGSAAAVGWTTLVVAGWGVLKQKKEALPWLFSALALAVLALGPVLQVNGHVFLSGIPLPYALLSPTIFGQFMRHPDRFNIILALPISVLAALGWRAILARWRQQHWRTWGATLGLALLILFEYCTVPVPTVPLPDSAFYQRLKEEQGEFAVADFPIQYARDKYYLTVQTLHNRPMVGGHVSRPPVGTYDFIERVPLLVIAQERAPGYGELADVTRQLKPLAEVGVRYAIIHKDRTTEERIEGWRQWFGFRPVYEDDLVLAYRTEPKYGRDFDFLGYVGDGIGIVAAALSPPEVSAGDVVKLEVVWGTAQEPQQDWQARVWLLSERGERVDIAEFEPFEGWPTSEWGAGEVTRRVLTTRLDPFMNGGRYQVMVGLVDGPDAGVAIGEAEIEGIDWPSRRSEKVGALFGEAIQLMGYDLRRRADELAVTLHWYSLRRMDESYKFFVHLYDIGSGELVAQADVVPLDWAYPTTRWKVGEVVSDEVILPLNEVPPGRYQLAVGIYDPQNGERLPVQDKGRALSVISDALIMQEVTLP